MKLVKISKTPCGGCVLLGNHLNELGVEYAEIDIFKSSEEDVKSHLNTTLEDLRSSLTSVPVLILTDDEGNEVERVNGFNPPAVAALLEKM